MDNLETLARLEERYLDPDYDTSRYSEEKEEAMLDEADRRYAERCLDRK